MTHALLDSLNERQRLVATTFDAPVCVMAGAGTGKTRAITHRIAYGIHSGRYQADQVLALTFTQKAAQEMATRVRGLGVERVSSRTFHSAALRQLQHFWPKLTDGFLPEVVTSKAGVIAHVLDTLQIEVDQAVLRDLASEIEWRKVKGFTVEDYFHQVDAGVRTLPPGVSAQAMQAVMEGYEKVKDERRRMDFEDVLLATVGMLESEPAVAERVRATYRHLVVDEYQDVSPIQQRLVDLWLGGSGDICVVGDASQTIYTFAGATSDYLVRFGEAYPDARVITLDDNYRSSQDIITAANLSIHGQPGAVELRAHTPATSPLIYASHATDQDEASWVATRIGQFLEAGYQPSDIAVLHRFSAQALLTDGALRAAGVSVRSQGGTRFFDQPHVKRAVMEIRGAAVAHTPGLVHQVVADILFGLGLTSDEPEHGGATRSAWEDLQALRDLAENFGEGRTLQEFSEELVRRAQAHDEPTMQSVTLATVHAAKGQEWPVVCVVGLSEGQFPISYADTADAVAEEQRLFYVAITRAKEQLALSWAKRNRSHGGAERQISRFLRPLGIAAESH